MSKENATSQNRPNTKLIDIIFGGDKALWVVVIALLILSVFVSYSSMAYKERISSTAQLFRQLKFIGLGFCGFFFIQFIRYQWYRKMTKPFFYIALILTVVMLVWGNVVPGTTVRRSLTIPGTSFNFQPFELLKITVVMMLADALAKRHKIIDIESMIPSLRPSKWRIEKEKNREILYKHTLPIFVPVVIACTVTMKTSNSTTAIIMFSCAIMLFIGRMKMSDLGRLLLVMVVLLGGLLLVMGTRKDTGQSRIKSFDSNMFVAHADPKNAAFYLNPDEREQSTHAKMAIASGGIIGRGPGMSTHRSILEEAESDMAYSFIVEEYGFMGGLIVLLLYLTLFYRAIEIFKKCGTAFPSLMVLGLAMMTTFQAIIHILVSVSLIPITGQQLPLVSNGGSSLIFTMLSLGMIMGVSRQVEEKTIDATKDETMFEKQ